MILSEKSTIKFWLNYFSETIKDDIEIKGGVCKIQILFTGNLLLIKGYCSIKDYRPIDVLDETIESNPEIIELFGQGVRNQMIFIDETPFGIKRNICHSYYNSGFNRPIITDIHSEITSIYLSDIPFGYSLNYKTPIYYGEHIAKDLLRFTRSELVHIDYTEPEDLKLNLKSIYPIKSLESCVLDIYDFDFEKFQFLLKDYDFKKEILEPLGEKPWLKDSKLNEYIIF